MTKSVQSSDSQMLLVSSSLAKRKSDLKEPFELATVEEDLPSIKVADMAPSQTSASMIRGSATSQDDISSAPKVLPSNQRINVSEQSLNQSPIKET